MKIEKLLLSDLFKGCDKNILTDVLKNITTSKYKKHSIIVQEYEKCSNISFILKGCVCIDELLNDGDKVRIKLYEKNDSFGCALFGSENKNYPFTLIAYEDTEILHIPFSVIKNLLTKDEAFMMNFISMLSNNILHLKTKIKILSLKTIREKFLYYINIKYGSKIINLTESKTEISKILGVSRGGLSRELKHMEKEGIISFKGKNAFIINNLL